MGSRIHSTPLLRDALASARALTGGDKDYDDLLAMTREARFVLIGEATHGTHEFYAERARITQRLIVEQGYDAVAVEADWPDAYRINRYVRGRGDDLDAVSALGGFERFPTWMWRNQDVLSFVNWLRQYNTDAAHGRQAGFYGLDLYSMFRSMGEVLHYLDQYDPPAASEARERYGCFDRYQQNSQRYAYASGIGTSPSCEHAVITQLHEMRALAHQSTRHDDRDMAEALFSAQQNARLVADAEHYYRTMLASGVSSWNLRDSYMAQTLDTLARHLSKVNGRPARIVVWAHNSHLGDASATDAAQQGEWNVGQLVREKYGAEAILVGLTTHHGSVTAASDWDAPAERKRVRPALDDSIEQLFHRSGMERFYLPLRGNEMASRALDQPLLQRAIGVIYRPHTEYYSHYLKARVARQFDCMLHFDATHALSPLELTELWHSGEPPETYPRGL
ncbi:MAG TPA: erythromycin esterase family protein [Burkholderiaceae bacterium]